MDFDQACTTRMVTGWSASARVVRSGRSAHRFSGAALQGANGVRKWPTTSLHDHAVGHQLFPSCRNALSGAAVEHQLKDGCSAKMSSNGNFVDAEPTTTPGAIPRVTFAGSQSQSIDLTMTLIAPFGRLVYPIIPCSASSQNDRSFTPRRPWFSGIWFPPWSLSPHGQ